MPVDSRPPADWKDPREIKFRQEREKVMPSTHLTLYVKVCTFSGMAVVRLNELTFFVRVDYGSL
jgi:hypothetical protein